MRANFYESRDTNSWPQMEKPKWSFHARTLPLIHVTAARFKFSFFPSFKDQKWQTDLKNQRHGFVKHNLTITQQSSGCYYKNHNNNNRLSFHFLPSQTFFTWRGRGGGHHTTMVSWLAHLLLNHRFESQHSWKFFRGKKYMTLLRLIDRAC